MAATNGTVTRGTNGKAHGGKWHDKYPHLGKAPLPADVFTSSLAEVSPAVELFGQPSVVDGYDIARFTAQRME